ncbi:hypothetical protein ASC97_12825 [Rhizobium sp. Root1203]|nr:hypothetical protein ASC97_12825 [Rhizobium sp. Root1203]
MIGQAEQPDTIFLPACRLPFPAFADRRGDLSGAAFRAGDGRGLSFAEVQPPYQFGQLAHVPML